MRSCVRVCTIMYCTTCRYLLDEDDEVSENIINFAVSYVGVLKVSLRECVWNECTEEHGCMCLTDH